METLACIKRVADTGAEIVLTDDKQSVDASAVGYTMGPHEECAIEAAVQVVEEEGGESTVLSLGPEDTEDQLYEGIGRGADNGVLLETAGGDWGPESTATAIADAIEGDLADFDLLFFGNESGDNANYQVGIRVAHELDLPVVTGAKDLEIDGDTAIVKRDVPGGSEVFEVETPAVVTVKEGLNTPRYPSMRSRMQAKKQEIQTIDPTETDDRLQMVELETPEAEDSEAEVLGEGPEAVDEAVEVMEELEVL
ncbi:electron transfer flavoprotein subunit beta [Halodesulfurarchaeum formicicum]|uniref:Electron transfer flavoprotein subunit beta n=1 Tax=Halodesulfurarchaeum formicicum TaxID=1873524 RepID=A0A1D8S6F6_9EURY|nr:MULTISPECIES: electron transfer flavoprotein subunit beta/FixA family protein [Halodesulfurarchaeum]AOW80918.1 electron transfer flavoprotein subunit beta [Halodesulfurarchaeum formicicum]APE96251.1 electron transfer flavoprotein subunit beta [Halodesulfurarchaeum formicicum]MDR5656487.1 electron transfer flavoprotein subunit beta/FixA family protein [Halodesulfurarchaeum sp. HSR-GB]